MGVSAYLPSPRSHLPTSPSNRHQLAARESRRRALLLRPLPLLTTLLPLPVLALEEQDEGYKRIEDGKWGFEVDVPSGWFSAQRNVEKAGGLAFVANDIRNGRALTVTVYDVFELFDKAGLIPNVDEFNVLKDVGSELGIAKLLIREKEGRNRPILRDESPSSTRVMLVQTDSDTGLSFEMQTTQERPKKQGRGATNQLLAQAGGEGGGAAEESLPPIDRYVKAKALLRDGLMYVVWISANSADWADKATQGLLDPVLDSFALTAAASTRDN
ncbi:unnamed protein product [Vitrella brassicaformis CCMP3155]|uniref:PsbP C-terminal domain-containing protein n=1 Tax=Vitrella brassicaformis (strain CCMP3155) TaxID=1169540 RepID=A0A0G4EAV5_VITBC|nr:unnamed protein product [Vitrella brassicaformis CCMP3155]|eukprot:CEL92583.1 unnamed protein product [Vitrella brassicaformis CCMP3155]